MGDVYPIFGVAIDITIPIVTLHIDRIAANNYQTVSPPINLWTVINYKISIIAYDEAEYSIPNNITETKTGDSRYFFITFCILATFVSVILMLLIVSRIFIFANKTACAHPRNIFQLEELSLRQNRNDITPFRSNLLGGSYRNRLILSNVRYMGNCNEVLEPVGEVSDPLLSPGSPERNICRTYIQDQPPSYSEVVDSQCDPPPPYTSRECLNVLDDRFRRN